jgi:predicted small secreted protein
MFKQIMLFVLLMAVPLSGCIPVTLTGSGKVVTQEEPITR